MFRRGTAAVAAGALVGGATALAVTLRAHDLGYPLWEYYHALGVVPIVLSMLLGAVPAVAFVRYRLLAPGAILALALASWLGAESNPLPGEPVLWLLYAFVGAYLLAMVLFGWFEFSVRSRVGRLPTLARR